MIKLRIQYIMSGQRRQELTATSFEKKSKEKDAELAYTSTYDQTGDFLTKALTRNN